MATGDLWTLADIEQLALEGRAAWSMMIKAMKKRDWDKMYYWNKVWCDINGKIRDNGNHT